MRKSFVALLLLVGAAAALATNAIAREDLGDNVQAKLINAQMQRELRAAGAHPGVTGGGDTVYVGFRPGNVSSVNYWGLGTGTFNVYDGDNPAAYGYWGWDNGPSTDNIAEAHGDSLFGWWPVRVLMNGTGGQVRTDENRPWWAVDIGNNANYVINQGTALKRTTGVVGVWHSDAGSGGGGGVTWAPLGGSRSMWAGLRRANDDSEVDPITGNSYNADVLMQVIQGGSVSGGPIGSDSRFPGYGNQWDQMAYRDIDVTDASTISVKFKFRSNMSTGRGTVAATRTGWFDKDPLAVTFNQSGTGNALGNFISSSFAADPPIDSFMVYVGQPVVDSLGSVPVGGGDWFISSANSEPRQVYDSQRRWFSEVLRVFDPGALPSDPPVISSRYREIFTAYGNNADATIEIVALSLTGLASNDKTRLVFRNKTNRGFADEDGFVSGWNGGGAGGAVFDDVEIALDAGAYTNIGDFEEASDVDNTANALDAWRTTGKPPSYYHHVHNMATLQYDDLCGEVDGDRRICNLRGNVISMGDHDNAEAAGGLTDGTVDREMWDGVVSPTINFVNGGGTNAMGINAEIANVTEDYYIEYDVYTGIFDGFVTGNFWRGGNSAYPAAQADGQPIWSGWRLWPFIIFNPDPQCFQDQEPGYAFGLVRWDAGQSESADYPDSLRILLHKRQECYRFGVTTNCSPTDGGYWDNVSLACVDGATPPMSINIWDWINDTFTVNGPERDANPLGGTEFDTTTALIKIGLNISQNTNNTARYAIGGDSTAVLTNGVDVRLDLVFRVSPGPGNYRSLGVRSTGLRGVPTSDAGIDYNSPGGNFWAEYLADGGPIGGSGNQHAANNVLGTNGGRDWSSVAWNSARCDSAEQNFWAIDARGIGGPVGGAFATIYHESDGKFSSLGIAKNRCWLINAGAGVTSANIACGDPSVVTDGWPTANGYVDEDGGGPLTLGQTYEYTKILPDGQFTPGTHVQYFFRFQDGAGPGQIAPDTTVVFPQSSEGSTDGHRWQQFSVLPDRWKRYTGLGDACMLFVDKNDRRGNERIWVSVADSIGATQSDKYGAHNGWHAVGKEDLDDPAGFVYKNEQPGTTWDMYGVKASESLTTATHGIGVDFSNHSPSGLINGQWSFCGPSIDMLEAFYSVILLLSGDLNSGVLGPFSNQGSDDHAMLEQFLAGGQVGETNHRGLWAMGDGFVESEWGLPLLDNYFEVTIRNPSYLLETNVSDDCIDLVTQTPITTNGDIYGIRNSCTWTLDVLEPLVGAVPSTLYSPANGATEPIVAGTFHDIDDVSGEYWQALADGFDIEYLRSRFCDKTYGRLAYMYNALANIFGKICQIVGEPPTTTDVPNNLSGSEFVNFMNLRNNPLVTGQATVSFGLARKDRVTVSVFDVSGRLVRELADREFEAGPHTITWDGVDNSGRQVARGVYFTQVKYLNSRFTGAKKLTVLK
jgi:hypothetical protein